ncbi:MAG: putative PLP-dependent enzyme involved in cell wall biosis [Mucilaginibacter sp.]|nr:putative PLP-dependent enzyme involved in cell wall biosis [Mucilaginibacter sp.]
MKIPFVDLKAQYNSIKTEIDTAISNVIGETAFIGGKYVENFEKNFAALYGIKHCISVANGTDSLFIIMKMLGIGTGDEVITVANSWISSSETISQTGAVPVFIDIDPDYYSISENLIEKAINSKTKAIMPVHLQGQVCEMDVIMAIAKKHNLYVIEDCAQSHFSEYKGKRAGTMGIAASFSFYPGKNLGAYGDAGCILTNDDDLAVKVKMYARHGALKKHQHQIEGVNSRLDGIQAAILDTKLPFILNWTEQRIKNAALYYQYLSDVKDIVLPKVRHDSKHTYHLFVIRSSKRNELAAFLKENDIETAVHYPVALPNMKAYEYLGFKNTDFPIASKYQDEILSIPMYPELTEEQIKYVASKIKEFYDN